jgi:hypothetical protein
MPTAREIAVELRKFADRLELNPDAEMDKPYISFYYFGDSQKQAFLNSARALPRPLVKSSDEGNLKLTYDSLAMYAYASIPKSVTCTLVEPARPAVYRCDPILSEDEEDKLEVA